MVYSIIPDSSSNSRLFFSVAIRGALQQALMEVVNAQSQQKNYQTIRWVTAEKLHLTLCFLGPTPANKVPELLKNVEKNIAKMATFNISCHAIIIFPWQKIKALVVNVPLSEQLAHLFNAVKQAVIATGLPVAQKAFLPHITLGRSADSKALTACLKTIRTIILPEQTIEQIALVRSDTLNNHTLYTPLHYLKLNNS